MRKEFISERGMPFRLRVTACSSFLEHLIGGKLCRGNREEAWVDSALRIPKSGSVPYAPEVILSFNLFHFYYNLRRRFKFSIEMGL